MKDSEIKVTDRRMFTPEGTLREEYKFLEEEKAGEVESAEPEATRPAEGSASEPQASEGAPPLLEFPTTPGRYGQPSFFDLLAMLAEPVALYLGDAELPDGGSAENLDMARLHIDLLDVLRRKTAGNLGAQELATLEDVLYRLRMRYVQKRG